MVTLQTAFDSVYTEQIVQFRHIQQWPVLTADRVAGHVQIDVHLYTICLFLFLGCLFDLQWKKTHSDEDVHHIPPAPPPRFSSVRTCALKI